MPKFELAIAVRHELDHTLGMFRKKEGDISSIRPYPRNCGRKVIDQYLMVIVECEGTQFELKTRLTAPLWENGLVENVDFRDFEKGDRVGLFPSFKVLLQQYPPAEYVWDIKNGGPMSRPKAEGKRRYKIRLNKLGNIDLAKVQNKTYIYQPFKKASQLVEKFDGEDENHHLGVEDVDCAATDIDPEQEVVFQWSATSNLVVDKYTNSYVGPDFIESQDEDEDEDQDEDS